MVSPQVASLDLFDGGTVRRVLDLQRAAYRVEADLIGFDGIPPLHETLDELLGQPLEWIGIRAGGRIVAALGYRLVVDPEHFGRGYGSALVASLLDQPCITVSTGTANLPARRLYEKHGFQRVGEVEIAPGVTVTCYARCGHPPVVGT